MKVVTNDEALYKKSLYALERVIDPEIGLNVVDLGLLYEVQFDQDSKKVICRMTLTTEFCPLGEQITDGVYQALHFVFPEHEIEIHLTFDPAWSQDRISQKGLAFLNR